MGDAAELPFHQLGSGKGLFEIPEGMLRLEQISPGFEFQGLERFDAKKETVVVDRDQGIAAGGFTKTPGDDPGERIICTTADQAVEEVVDEIGVVILVAKDFDEGESIARDGRESFLGHEMFEHGFRVEGADVPILDEPFPEILLIALEPFPHLGAKPGDLSRQAGSEGHLVGVPGRDGRKAIASQGDEQLPHPGLFQPHDVSAYDKTITDPQLLGEAFIDGAQALATEADGDRTIGRNGAYIHEIIALYFAIGGDEFAIDHGDFAKGFFVGTFERFPTAF